MFLSVSYPVNLIFFLFVKIKIQPKILLERFLSICASPASPAPPLNPGQRDRGVTSGNGNVKISVVVCNKLLGGYAAAHS